MTDSTTSAKMASARFGLGLITDGMRVGLGSGSTAEVFIRQLGRAVRGGLKIRATATSDRSARVAIDAGIRVEPLDEIGRLDLAVDGADEFDPSLNLIKGGGGALLQEKIVAAASRDLVILADESKRVACLGAYPLPVEIVRFGKLATLRSIAILLKDLGYRDPTCIFRGSEGVEFVTDEGHAILDLHLGRIEDAATLSQELVRIPGVVETGLFLGMANRCVVGQDDGSVTVFRSPEAGRAQADDRKAGESSKGRQCTDEF